MRGRAVHQVLVGAGIGDAITSMALTIRDQLRTRGESDIFAHYLASDVVGEVRPLAHFGRAKRGDLIVYHASFGEPLVTQFLMNRPERIIIIYHNITPSSYFLNHDAEFAAKLQWGRHELLLLKNRVVLALADSAFNATDLVAMGYEDVHVVPAGLRPSRLAAVPPSGRLAMSLEQSFPNGFVLVVSQALPHKRFETALQAMHLVQWVHERSLGLVCVGPQRMPSYQAALERYARHLRVAQVLFHGSASEQELATFFRSASVYLTTSAHEGLALPPLEAMSFGVPVVARSAGALAETIGSAGVVLPADAGPELLSEAIAEIDTNIALRSELRQRGFDRVRDIEADDPSMRFMELLETAARP